MFCIASFCFANQDPNTESEEVISKECSAGGDVNKKYFLISSGDETNVNNAGFGLIVVLPGETGGADMLDFVKEIYKDSFDKNFIVAQLVAKRWNRKQRITWPTETDKVDGQLFSTEEFIEAVIADVRSKYNINKQQIFSFCWDSAGQAGYMASVRKDTPIAGSLIVMSNFQISWLGSNIGNANGKAYYIMHSVADDICPVEMPQLAYKIIADNGGIVKMEMYKGGHGWQGNSLGMVKLGMRWLSKDKTSAKGIPGGQTKQPEQTKQAEPEEAREIMQIVPLSNVGDIRFGMNKNVIIKILGQPEQEKGYKLFYISHGLQLTVSPKDESLILIACGATNEAEGNMIKLCNCKTSENIGMGSSRENIAQAYGKPSSEIAVEENVITLFYDNIKAQFILTDNKVTYMVFKKP